MYIKFDSLDRYETPDFILCNPGSVYKDDIPTNIVGILTDTSDEEFVFNFNSLSELNFRVTKIHREDYDDNMHMFKLYKAIQNRRLIFVDKVGYFAITDIKDGIDAEGFVYKDVTAKSGEVELENKMIPFIDDGTYKFASLLETLVGSIPLWTIGYVDDTIAEKYRTFEDVSTDLNCLAFMLDNMQEAYECIFIFDTINRTINVYDQNNYVKQTNIHITKDDLINSIDITENSEDLYTAISVLGDENVTIAAINPLGTNVIYNFDYYLSWMTETLSDKVFAWQKAIKDAKDEYYSLNLEYYQKLEEQSNYQFAVEQLNSQITMYKRCRNNIVAESDTTYVESYNKAIKEAGGKPITIQAEIKETLASIDDLIAECESEKNAIISKLTDMQTEMTELTSSIEAICSPLGFDTYFTTEELSELSHYIYEGGYSDDYVTITDNMTYEEKFEQMKILYDRAEIQLEKVSRPLQEFNIDVENFIFEKRFQEWSDQLETGCLVNVELDIYDVAALFLSTITINYTDHTLGLTFGNRFNKFDPQSLFDDVLGDISKSANTLSYIKDILYPIKNGELNTMKETIEMSRNITMGAALSSDTEEVIIDGSGYTGRKKLEDGGYDPRQVKLTGKSLVFTDDAWESCKVAIGELFLSDGETAYGINAETIIGNIIMGQNLHIVDANGDDILTVVDGKIQTHINDIDGRITEIEQNADSVEIRIKQLEDEDLVVDSVTTSTGYTFNQDGLKISNSESDIENRLDNTGMHVSRIDSNGDETESILTANNDGVNALNLSSRQYLIVGLHSRFEDYSTDADPNRTACFYIETSTEGEDNNG